jgi:choline dehydrogenase
MTRDYDFIIVGGGTAGCVLAERLSADPAHKVLLLEAGRPNRNQRLRIPMTARSFWTDPRYLWTYESEPEPNAAGRRIPVPRGKLLGGSGAINGMLYARGHPRDYDQWRQLGLEGWGYDDVLPYFKRVERDSRGDGPFHGGGGALAISRTPNANALTPLFIAALKSRGIRYSGDHNGAEPEGFGPPDLTISNGERASTYSAFLRPAMARPNLTVETHAHATRVVIENWRAGAVEYVRNGAAERARAAREIVLSGGAYNSPQLLLLSGIGPAEELRALGIAPVYDLPGVGRNLQDHAGIGVACLLKEPVGSVRNLRYDRLALAVLRWAIARSGPVATAPVIGNAFYRTRPELERPDIQTLFLAASPLAGPWFPGIKKPAPHMLASRSVLLHPESRGHMRLASADPLAPPRIFFNLFGARADLVTLREALKGVRDIYRAAPLAQLAGSEVMPGENAATDAEIETYIRNTVTTAYHPVGTCAMGAGEDAVVDTQLKVRGIVGLRVADASVMPLIVGGNTNAATVMIGDKAADLILGRRLPRAELGLAQAAE